MSNHITLIGNVTRDPELRFSNSGQARTVISLATNRRYLPKGAVEPTEVTSYFTVVAWGQLAEHAVESLRKGDRVTATGRVDHRKWADEDGKPHNSFEVVADDVALSLRFRAASPDRTRRESAAPAEMAPVEPAEAFSADHGGDESTDNSIDDSVDGLTDRTFERELASA
jgi:single-strand DNA-binding protein